MHKILPESCNVLPDELAMSPPRERFRSVLLDTFAEIPRMLCHAALPLDGSVNHMMHDDGMESEANGLTQDAPRSSRYWYIYITGFPQAGKIRKKIK